MNKDKSSFGVSGKDSGCKMAREGGVLETVGQTCCSLGVLGPQGSVAD